MVSKITKRTNYKKSYKNKKAKAKKNSRKSKYNRKNVSKKGNYKKNKSSRYSRNSKSSVKSGKKQRVNKRNMRGGKCRYAIVDEPGFSIDKTVIGEGSIINGLNIGGSKGLVGKFGCDDEISQP